MNDYCRLINQLLNMILIIERVCTKKFVYHTEKFSCTMALGTSVRFSLITFFSIIVMEGRRIFTDSEYGLIQCLAHIS